MVITEEIIAAYVEGKVSNVERKEVRRYLAFHPEMQDLVLALMDDSDEIESIRNLTVVKQVQPKRSHSDIAYAAAAFAPRMEVESPQIGSHEDLISQRLKRMSAFWNELQKDM